MTRRSASDRTGLSLHDALPIYAPEDPVGEVALGQSGDLVVDERALLLAAVAVLVPQLAADRVVEHPLHDVIATLAGLEALGDGVHDDLGRPVVLALVGGVGDVRAVLAGPGSVDRAVADHGDP